eukprot:1631159-Rhodomonas_salina.1
MIGKFVPGRAGHVTDIQMPNCDSISSVYSHWHWQYNFSPWYRVPGYPGTSARGTRVLRDIPPGLCTQTFLYYSSSSTLTFPHPSPHRLWGSQYCD